MKILIFGASGMLGHTLFRDLQKDFEVLGTVRTNSTLKSIIGNVSIDNLESVDKIITQLNPNVVINCIAFISKEKIASRDLSVKTNSLWPHQLSNICKRHSVRFIHFSSDGVFSGNSGDRRESDFADARDLNGLSKLLGEVLDDHALNLRLSIIGHELAGKKHLVEWFLNQKINCTGYRMVNYNGLPTIIVSEILRKHVLASPLNGVYHLSGSTISKYDLLTKIAAVYGKEIEILADDETRVDRTLNSEKFQSMTGYQPESWDLMIEKMHRNYINPNS